MPTVANVQSRIAGLADDSQTISGVAIGVGDVTRGLSGDRKVWQADELRAAAASLEGTPVNALHSQAQVGEVVRAGFDAGRGVVYEAELEDAKLADRVANGGLEVSIEARHADGGTVETEQGEAMAATDIQFEALALVQHGAAPSASASPGEAAALSPSAIRETLEEDPASTDGDAEDIDISDQTETALENKVEEHNADAPESKQVTLSMLKKVYRRGAGAWFSSNAGATQQQWALARVNAFLEDLMADRQLNSGNDNDLAPDGYGPAQESNAALVEVNGTEIDLSPPDRVINAVEAAMDAKEEYADAIGDCGTGVGEEMGRAIMNEELTPEIVTTGGDIASNAPATYLDGHGDEGPATDDPPTDWSRMDWLGMESEDDSPRCGPVQLALWGYYQDWFEGVEEEVTAAMEDSEMAYHEDADMAEVPDEYVLDNPGEAVEKADEMGFGEEMDLAGDEMIHTHGDGEDTVFMPGPSHEDLMDRLREMGELPGEDAEMEQMNVGPLDFTGTAEGELDESEIPSEGFEPHYLNAGDTKSESSFPLVDADGDLRRGNLDAGWNLRGQGDLGMPRETAERVMLNLGLVFGPPDSEENPLPEDAYDGRSDYGTPYAAEAAGTTDDPGTGEDAAGTGSDTNAIAALSKMSETEEELRAKLNQRDERIAELEDRVEQLEDEREEVAGEYADALAGDSVFSAEELSEKFTVSELAEKYDAATDGGASLADAEPAVQSGGSDADSELASLSESEQAEVGEHRDVIAQLAGAEEGTVARKELDRRVERVAELTGNDRDTIIEEAD